MESVKKVAEFVGVCSLFFSSVAFAFTLGYLNVLAIPETPTLIESLSFYVRAIENTQSPTFNLIKQMFIPFLLCWLFVRLTQQIPWSKMEETKLRKYAAEFAIIAVGCTLLWTGAVLAYKQGAASIPRTGAAALFPLARAEDKSEDEMRLIWLGHQGLYWIGCNQLQSQLIGYKNGGQIFFIKRLDSDLFLRFCT